MPAYVSRSLSEFVTESSEALVGELNQAYARDGFASQYTSQMRAWSESIPDLQAQLSSLVVRLPDSGAWRVLLELPLYRLRRRIDLLILTEHTVVVLELKVGADRFTPADERQVEEYSLDLRDFHSESAGLSIVPCLLCTGAPAQLTYPKLVRGVAPVHRLGDSDLAGFLERLRDGEGALGSLVSERWESGAYQPVPDVIQAATSLFSGHGVREITRADATNLRQTAERVIELVDEAREQGRRVLIFVTGVPGSGKTLAGLQVVHGAIESGVETDDDIVYLSGNTPLVTVLREALARDKYRRARQAGEDVRIGKLRSAMRTKIQHIIDYLQEYLVNDTSRAPAEHVVVFDEAQRAWGAKFGEQRFERPASEPQLLIEIMTRHPNWCALVCLVGGGQEINTGENGMAEWGQALRNVPSDVAKEWTVVGPEEVVLGGETTGGLGLGQLPTEVEVVNEDALRLTVPMRSFRSPAVSGWVRAVIDGDAALAASEAARLSEYPIVVTRSLGAARHWLKMKARGERRCGLLSSSGARRLRAEGMGVTLNATDGIKIAQWYLNPPDDVRSSFALEVMANEYTSQGLELDFCGICWGGDFLWDSDGWSLKSFRGNRWDNVSKPDRRRFVRNSYRVLLTRAREGMVIWVPRGSSADATRPPGRLDGTFQMLLACGAMELVEGDA